MIYLVADCFSSTLGYLTWIEAATNPVRIYLTDFDALVWFLNNRCHLKPLHSHLGIKHNGEPAMTAGFSL
jgi:hypothetical protein